MKLLDRILQGQCHMIELVDEGRFLRTIPVVLANEVADLYYYMSSTEKGVWPLDGMGPMLPRYPDLWIEWAVPQHTPYRKDGATIASETRASQLVGWTQAVQLHAEEFEDGWHWRGIIYDGLKHGVQVLPLIYGFDVDKDGRWLGPYKDGTAAVDVQILPDPVLSDLEESERMAKMGLHVLKIACSTLGLMNCRNVEVMEMTSSTQMRRARKRHSRMPVEPVERWGIIRLPAPARRTRDADVAVGAMGPSMPAHIVGGHFKTYTEEHKLFGKATGTYWWGSFFRGNPNAGNIRRVVKMER